MSEQITLDTLASELAAIRQALASDTTDREAVTKAIADLTAKDNGQHGGTTPAPTIGTPAADGPNDLSSILTRPAQTDAERAFQRASDRYYTARSLMGRDAATGEKADPRTMRTYRELQVAAKALNTSTDAAGQDFVPTGYSNQLIDEIRLERRIPGLFQQITIPRSPWKWPVAGSIGLPYLLSEQTVDTASLVGTRTPGTTDVTFTAKTFGVRVPYSMEFDEDSIVAAEQYVRQAIAKSLVDGLETAILNGDTTATHQDSAVTASNDVRRMFKGLRAYAFVATATTFDTTETTNGTAAWDEPDVPQIRAKLSEGYQNAEDLVLIVSPKAYMKMLVNAAKSTSLWPNYVSLDKLGPRAINVTGEVGAVQGTPIVVSAYCPQTTDASGYDTGSGTVGVVIMANRKAFALATQASPTLTTVWDPESLQYRIVGHSRVDFQPWRAQGTTTDRGVAVGIKVAIA